jgi:two-component system nitrogen regulation response regulator GlnG
VTFGVSKQARELERRVRLLAETPGLSLLLQGESGTGKEVVARTIHDWSPRRTAPFVAVDCGALPEPLLESLLFGHRRGAFTGADQDREGLFVEAHTGTLFLDELGNLPAGLQAKLLRCLQEREVRPLGSDKPVPFDVRLIAAANVDLLAETQRGRFRLDLYHRVAEFVVRIPPLRERPEDVLHFADCLLARVAEETGRGPARLTAAAKAHLSAHRWPGNLRELFNCLRRAALLAAGDELGGDDLDLAPETQALVPGFEEGTPLTEQVQTAALRIERAWIEHVLAATGGNKAEAARRLGVDYTTLHRKLKRHGLDTMAPSP